MLLLLSASLVDNERLVGVVAALGLVLVDTGELGVADDLDAASQRRVSHHHFPHFP